MATVWLPLALPPQPETVTLTLLLPAVPQVKVASLSGPVTGVWSAAVHS
jgi:hypothetical protein